MKKEDVNNVDKREKTIEKWNKSLKKQKVWTDIRVTQALELRLGGNSWDQIFEELEIEGGSDFIKKMKKVISRVVSDNVEQYRAIESLRIDALWRKIYPLVMVKDGEEPNWNAFDRCVRLMNHRRELLGLDVPKQSILKGNINISHDIKDFPDNELLKMLGDSQKELSTQIIDIVSEEVEIEKNKPEESPYFREN